ncbi:diguanylate cyclase [Paraglaciecola sp.]|uniref:sensor domain-containing diguanylate cyclase n=1 Tax=Paraglaciecola sp. TaxID=1920173 RepID=UPI00273D9E5A|nr:diguanylate cyclase [Paraglaciecola sp.]MDP5033218.1 GGDEF domain-containing protein [Paraglaciecola sp.]
MFALLFSVVVEIKSNLFQEQIMATEGRLDLSALDLTESEPVPLKGKWQFYWQQFVESENVATEIPATHDFIQTPLSWERQEYLSEPLPSEGFATYRLRVNIKTTNEALALSLPVMGSAYRLYINQQLVDEVGQISTDKSKAIPDYSPKIVVIDNPGEQLDLILQISNYDLAWGGQWSPITLGSADKQFQTELIKLLRSVTIAAIFFTIAVLSLFHFALRPSDLLPFLLALSCICLGVREIETSHLIYFTDAVSLGFSTIVRINFLSFYLSIPLFTSYFHISYPKEFRFWPFLIICSISAAFSLHVLFSSTAVFTQYLVYFQGFALVVLVYGLYSIMLAAYRRRIGARLIALGSLLLFALSINDILYSLRIIDTGSMASLGLLSFALCQNYLTYVRFIKDSQAMKTLSVQANHDPLTMLLNRRGLMDSIHHIVSEQRQTSAHFCVLLIDFDHFKRLNDTLGHDAGDTALAKGSAIMQTLIRRHDLIARWGGEEFVLILPNTDKNGAKILAEKIRIKLSNDLSEQLKYPITASIGVAQSLENENFADCLKRADKALYMAKEQGRNRVEQV